LDQANALLVRSLYQLYRHTETNEADLYTVYYTLPAVLLDYVLTLAPTT
jgi:hypothetical protein